MSKPERRAAGKVVDLETLLGNLAPAREKGAVVVFTNGCFDIMHAGHLHLLESAAGYGDILVVGLNGDDSIRRLKGDPRPWITFEERSLLLGGLEVVDWVVGFDEDTPTGLIERVVPDVLVKGGDWTPDRIVGRETVERHGGRVLSIPLLEGRSTSDLVERIARSTPR
jgi:D-beta-D-heptose 7-phosphate kinase/D-beta-D-heptose 1-phosphate adenosyltransferase